MKLRKAGFNPTQNVPIKIPDKFYSKNTIIQATIEKLRTECAINEQQKLIKMLLQYSSNAVDSEFSTLLLTYLFLTVDTKHPIRKTISRVLLTANNDLVRKTLSENILFLINTDKGNKDFCYQSNHEIIIDLQNCFNNFPLGIESISDITDYVTPYVINLFLYHGDKLSNSIGNQTEIENSHSFIYSITKLLVSLVQQCTLSTLLANYSGDLMFTSYKIIMDDYLSFDIKCNCGVLLVIAVIHIPNQAMTEFKSKRCLNLLKLDKTNDNAGLLDFKNLTENYTANLCVYSGILNVVPQNILCEELIDGIPVISFMFGKLIDYAKRSTGKPSQMLEVSRALILISKIMNTIPLTYVDLMFSQGLDYVWTHLDHFVDTVKNSAKSIFENLIKLAYRHYINGCTHLMKMILTNTIDLLVNRSTHYVVLSIISAETGCSFLLEQFSRLPFILLKNIVDLSVAPQICTTYESLMAQHAKEETDINKWLELWVDLVKPLLVRSESPVTIYYQRLLISAYKIQPLVLKSVIHYRHHNGANELGALLGCLKFARKSGLVLSLEDNSENNVSTDNKKCWRGYIELEFLQTIMCHQSDEIRVSALALVVENQKSTEIFSTWELDFLKKYFHYNANTQIPSTRQRIIALYKRAVLRIKEGMCVLVRQITSICNKVKTEADKVKEESLKELHLYKKQEINYKVFIQSFFQDYLCPGIHYGFNYYRRSTCLELILFVLNEKCIDLEDFESNWKTVNTMALLGVLSDSYESNIAMAFDILKQLPSNVFTFLQSKECVRTNILNAINLASAIKPSSATTAGYMLPIFLMSPYAREVILDILEDCEHFSNIYMLAISLFIQLIEAGVKLARQNLLEAIRTSPVYGYILCVRHLMHKASFGVTDQWQYLLSKLVSTCRTVSEIVSPIVNNLSPEGYMPVYDGFINEDLREVVTSQMVLVYAWRTTKEVSLLLGELALSVSTADYKMDKPFLSNYIMPISEHFLTLFFETKHRGAYEQAYVGFCKFCEKLWKLSHEDLKSLPKLWLNGILDVLKRENKNAFYKLCPTRRSAGLPFMIQAILITEPKTLGNENFHLCMRTLLDIAVDVSEENIRSRIHSMNILRSLYRNNNLAELVTQYIAQGVIIALSAFNHDKWGIRNSATLLFATLIIRIFGVQRNRDVEELSLRNRLSARVFFMRYPKLSNFLLEQIIKTNDNSQDTAALHSVLLILERLYPCTTEEENQLDKYTLHVAKCLSNSIYGIRRLAAQSSTALIPRLEVVTYIKKILIILSDVTHTENYCQGLIMQLICLLRCVVKGHSPLNVPDLIEPTFWIPISVGRYISHYTAALYFDMLVALTTVFSQQCQGTLVFDKLLKILAWQSIKDTVVEEELFSEKYRVCHFNLHLHIMSNLYHRDNYFKSQYVKKVIMSGLRSIYQEINQYCLNIINYLYLDRPKYMKHSLYITEQLEISDREYKVVKSFDLTVKEYLMEVIHMKKKLFPILYELLAKSKESCLSVLLMLQHYPCILIDIKPHKQDVLDFFIKWCYNEDDELFCASVSVISTFLYNLSNDDIKQINGNALIKTIIEASSPRSTLYQRIGAAQFLVANKRLLYLKDSFVDVDALQHLWNAVIVLLEDEDQMVRNTISHLASTDFRKPISMLNLKWFTTIAEKAREELLNFCVTALPRKVAILLLLSWALRQNFNEEKETIEVFDKGETNTFAEEVQLAKLATSHLKELLWKLDQDLHYNDNSISIEEHALLVANVIYNSLHQVATSSSNINLKFSLRVIENIVIFLETCPINNQNFTEELGKVISNELNKLNSKDHDENYKKLKFVFSAIFTLESI